MTVNSNYEINSYKANGVITSFAFDFQVLTKNDLVVDIEDLDGNITEQIIDVDYSVSLNENDTGNIIFNTAPANDYNVYIQRNVLIDQNVVYKTSSGFQAEVVETSFDKLTMINQQQQSELDRCLKLTQLTTDKFVIGDIVDPDNNKALIWKKVDDINNIYNIVNSENNPDEMYDKTANNPNVIAVANDIDNIDIAANNINNIVLTGQNIDNVNTVAENIDNVNTVAENIDAITTKANIDLNNITTTGKELIYTANAPDYANIIPFAINVEYTASSNGYVWVTGTTASGVNYILKIDSFEFPWQNNATVNALGFALMPVAKGDTYKVSSSSGAINNYTGYFIPVKTI